MSNAGQTATGTTGSPSSQLADPNTVLYCPSFLAHTRKDTRGHVGRVAVSVRCLGRFRAGTTLTKPNEDAQARLWSPCARQKQGGLQDLQEEESKGKSDNHHTQRSMGARFARFPVQTGCDVPSVTVPAC